MKIALGADHGGYQLKEIIKKHLESKGYEVVDKGTYSTDSVDYPDYAKAVATAILENEVERGILVCGTGIGISIAANRFKGIRAALCNNTTMAKLTREHNNANILALGGRMTGDVLALEMVDVFLDTEFQGGRHQTRIDKIDTL
ncbi:ribose 5-phosphate isomerase B [Cetobacterium ceti]|uniref:Ribose 5-phosphate isomerase B n=1 Tax=Cetobacterium ceti TaxID=180163 RepID=A0A1T4K451_9FUSO|nr:ribose 5-phosphate isomerase B [Cetobacterium ceti]SJZ37107.1 ribose 5-phosphate isomerase B [Cetobacterium ceti]